LAATSTERTENLGKDVTNCHQTLITYYNLDNMDKKNVYIMSVLDI